MFFRRRAAVGEAPGAGDGCVGAIKVAGIGGNSFVYVGPTYVVGVEGALLKRP
jgi:hypothetical protein